MRLRYLGLMHGNVKRRKVRYERAALRKNTRNAYPFPESPPGEVNMNVWKFRRDVVDSNRHYWHTLKEWKGRRD